MGSRQGHRTPRSRNKTTTKTRNLSSLDLRLPSLLSAFLNGVFLCLMHLFPTEFPP